MIAFLRSWSNGCIPRACFSVTQLQSHQLLLLQQGASTETKGLSAKAPTATGQGHLASAPRRQPDCWAREAPPPTHSAEVRSGQRDAFAPGHIGPLHTSVTLPMSSLSLRVLPCNVRRWQHTANFLTAVPGTSCCV